MGIKRCRVCREDKPLETFRRNAKAVDGHNSICRSCQQTIDAKKSAARLRSSRPNDKELFELKVKRYLLALSRRRARESGIEHTIQADDIMIPETCPILGLPLEAYRGGYNRNSYSLDRVDNAKGYIPGNIRVISWRANVLKSSLTLAQAERIVAYIKGEI